MRLMLIDKRMKDDDVFLVDEKPVPRGQEEHTAVEDALLRESRTNILLISSQRWG